MRGLIEMPFGVESALLFGFIIAMILVCGFTTWGDD